MKRILLIAVLMMVQLGFGQTNTWDGSSDRNWNTAANWSLNLVPTPAHDVVIPNGITGTITVNTAAVCRTFTMNGGDTANTVTISGTNSLTVSGAITINAGTTNNANKILAVGTGSLSTASITMAQTNTNRNSRLTLSTGTITVIGTVDLNSVNTNNAIIFSNSGTLNIGGTMTGGALNAGTGTVNYNNGGAQTVGTYTYNNLTLSGRGIKTFNATTTVNGNLSIASGIITNLGTFTHTAKTLTLGGSTTPSGFWGSTTSSATNKNNTYFADTTGIVNVGSSTCTSPTVYTMTGSGNLCTGSAGNIIGLSNSEIGVSYQLVRNSVNVGSVIAGTGSSISFGLQNSVGDYTVIATRNNTFCSMIMTGVVTITIASLPPLPVGATIVDASCNASVGSITLANQNHALEFVKTSSQYVRTVTPFLSNLNSFTMEGWIKYKTSDLNTTGFTSLFGQNDVLEFGFQDSRLHLYTLNGGNIYATPPVSLGDNTWHHVAAVGTGSKILIYVDGVVVGSGGNTTSNYGASAFNVNIGAGVFNATAGFFDGQIMKVGFYNTALSAARIASLAYSPIAYTGTESGLIAGYNFQEGSGTTLASLPVGKNGILDNTPIWRDPYTYAWTKTGTPAYTAATKDIVGLSPGEYNLNFGIGKGCSRSISYAIGTKATTWNGTSWTPSLPTIDHNIEFTGSYTSNGDINGCSCTVTSGNVLFKAGHTLTITNAVNVTNNASTSLVFENNASLVQITNATNTGAIEYRRTSSPMKNFDFTYWASPVSGQTAKSLSPNTLWDKYFRFSGSANDWVFDDGEMKPGVGFIIRTPKPGIYGSPYPETVVMPYAQPVAFKGVPNNGDYTFTAGAGQFNLLGNPYPSAIDADKFINANSGIINGALYFWTHNTAIAPSGSDYVYTADDYASYTLTGGTGTGNFVDTNGNGIMEPNEEMVSNRPLGKIAAGQSFFVESKAIPTATQFVFNNNMRVAGNNSQFFKQVTNTKKSTTIEKNRVWLNLSNSKGAFKQLLVGYITGATNDWDNLYDGPTFDGQEFVDFYSVNLGQNLTIQGRTLPFVDTDIVPLGYRSTIAGSFDISIDNRDGALTNQEIWLEDKKTNTMHDLTKGKYTFIAIDGVENDRFVLKYTNKTLGTEDNELANKALIVSVKNKKITVTSSAEAITQVQVFDLLGRKVYDKSKINTQEWTLSNLSLSNQILIVKTTLANGAISNKKISY